MEFVDEGGVIRLLIRRRVPASDPAAGYGLVKVKPSKSGTRSLLAFDPADLVKRRRAKTSFSVDTNILARFYCDDPEDPEATRQRPIARRIILESPAIFVPFSVVLELEGVMRGFTRSSPPLFVRRWRTCSECRMSRWSTGRR